MADTSPRAGANPAQVLAGLDDEQVAAVTAPAGPLCVLAGAGTGKTRAITHRIAHRVVTGQIEPPNVLAVTFTARAAAEMRGRLAGLGVTGVSARTFHAAALRQVRYFGPRVLHGRSLPELVESKVRLVSRAAARVGVRTDPTLARDLASEIEWAKSSLVEPQDYAVMAAKAGRETPLPPDQVGTLFSGYEQDKRAAGLMDFEDLLRAAAWAIEEHSDVAEQVRTQYRHLVVDEYQDVSPLQQRLLDAWLGGRRDLTVVGDASQTIYSFTGASSGYLLDFPCRYRDATVVRLVRDYRSTPQIVGVANAVIRQARGTEARLRLELVGQRPPGPEPDLRFYPDEPAEAVAVAARCAELAAAGVPARGIAVLFRTNAQSEAYEEALAEAGVPYVVQGAERFFERVEVRQALVALRAAERTTAPGTPLVEAVVAALEAVAWRPDQPPAGGATRERWEALAALVGVAEELARGSGGATTALPTGVEDGDPPALADFNNELRRRAHAQHAPSVDGVTLASLHAAKGLEWDAVFVVGLAEGTLPTTYAKTPEQLEEERRLLYVGITRARQWLWLSYAGARSPGGRQRRGSRFLPGADPGAAPAAPGPPRREGKRAAQSRRTVAVFCRVCGAGLVGGAERKLGRCLACPSDLDEDLLGRLVEWRARVAGTGHVPAYVVFTDATLTALAERRPAGVPELIDIAGIGPRKLALYGEAVLALIAGASVDAVAPADSTT